MLEKIQFDKFEWLNLPSPTDEELDDLQKKYNFHPLDIEDCKSSNQRPKIDVYDDYNFLILHFPYFDKNNKLLRVNEMKIFWGKDFIITVGHSHSVIRTLFASTKHNPAAAEEFMVRNSDTFLYTILDRLMVESYSLLLRLTADWN